jgi:hypothetical protein
VQLVAANYINLCVKCQMFLVDSGDGRGVVSASKHGAMVHQMVIGNDGHLTYHMGVFQVAVDEVSDRAGRGHEGSLNSRWKREAPGMSLAIGVKVHSTHSGLGGVGGSHECRVLAGC